MSYLKDLQGFDDRKYPNDKITKLTEILERLFQRRPLSKVIIFVQIRKVAVFLARLLCKIKPRVFKAKEFISTGNNENDEGMQARERIDVRKLFEGDKYNILVATSVAEEGLDIQACNMVIRYMYIKDMIAKIQSRGRARHPEGILLTFLNERLQKQEQKNDYRETLMYTALEEIQGMDLGEFQSTIRHLASQQPTSDSETDEEPHMQAESYQVHCRLCSNYLCELSDIRRYMKSYHLVLNPRIHEKVDLKPLATSFLKFFDGIDDCMKMLCSQDKDGAKCGEALGKVIRMNNKYFYAVWSPKKIILHNNAGGGSVTLDKYKEISEGLHILLQDVYIEDVEELATGSFPLPFIEAAQRRRRS